MRIGVDLGGTKIEGVVLDGEGAIVERRRVATESERGYRHIVERVGALVESLRAFAPDCERIGVGTPGAVSRVNGAMKNSNTQCLNGRDLPGDLRRRIALPVVVENDANCFALAEALHGAGRGHDVVFGVILGTGVGGGIVARGRLISGAQHIAGEWGHHVVDPSGPPCYCGARGCVETYLSGPALQRAWVERGGQPTDTASLAARWRAGDARAMALRDEYLQRFGRALANLIAILDPDAIVLGGGLSNLDELYTEGRAAVARAVFNDELLTPIVRNQLGDSAGVIGAALLD